MAKGLYIHVPFCVRKCRYCDFYSVTELSLTEDYTRAVVRNIGAVRDTFDTVYFGGGTPSLLTAEQLFRILSAAEICGGAEVSMECNPNSVTDRYLKDIFCAGVNRLSFGVQSFNDTELRSLGRLHTAEEAVAAVYSAERAGFENISADLMLAVGGQTMKGLARSLETAAGLPLKHISAYMLKIEEGTPLSGDAEYYKTLPSEDDTADMYLYAVEYLADKGFEQYEISNFSKVGFECRHNLKYWRGEEYYGIGPAAHSFVDGERRYCPKNLQSFLTAETQENVFLEYGGDADERAMLTLRLTKEGLDLSEYPKAVKPAELLAKNGLLKNENGFLKLTPKGCLVSNAIIASLTE